METIILLKLEVDSEKLRKGDEPDSHIQAKVRSIVSDIVGYAVNEMEGISLIASSLGAMKNKDSEIFQVQESPKVTKMHARDLN